MTLHSHDYYECLLYVSGDISYQVDEHFLSLQPYDVILLSPNMTHRPIFGNFSIPYERIPLLISRRLMASLSTEKSDLAQCFERGNHLLLRLDQQKKDYVDSLFARLMDTQEQDHFGCDVLSNALLLELLVFLNRCVLEQPAAAPLLIGSSEYLHRIIDYIDNHIGESITVDDLADAFYMSKPHFQRKFKIRTGTTPHRYILQRRMMRARDMILQGNNFTDIAINCGFPDYSTFFRAFTAEFGMSPRTYTQMLKSI